MLTATIRTNLRCNLGCGFCQARAAQDDPSRHGDMAIRQAIQLAMAEGAGELVFTGGEPLLCAELEAWIQLASGAGASVLVETNGTLLAVNHRASSLRRAGLRTVRVAVNGWGQRADRLARLSGAWAWTERGLQAALDAGLQVEASLALGAANLDLAADLPGQLSDAFPNLSALLLRVVSEAPGGHLAAWPALADVAIEVAAASRAVALPLRVDPRHGLPWCAVPQRRRWPELLAPPTSAHGGRGARLPICADCAVADRCPGLPGEHLARFGGEGLRPLGAADVRLIRSLSDRRQDIAAVEHCADQLFGGGDFGGQVERVLRPVFHCNQACDFCFVDRDLPAAAPEQIRSEIGRAAAEGVVLLSISGGEPTLDPHLKAHIAQARGLGLRVRLQTNAIRCARPGYAAELARAGLDEAFVSLHAADATRSDAITGTPGTLAKTLTGIDALVAAGVAVQANCVVTGGNADALEPVVELIAQRWGGRVVFNLSWAHASSGLVPVSEGVTPSFAAVRAQVIAAVTACGRHGIEFRGLDGQCGLPLCLCEPDWFDRERLPALPERILAGFVKAPFCAECALDDRCVGVRAGYAELYGMNELRPIQRRP